MGWLRRKDREPEVPAPESAPPGPPSAPSLEAEPAPETPDSVGAGSPPPHEESPEAEVAEPAPESKKGLFRRFRERLSRTREALAGGFDRIFAGRRGLDEAALEDLEELLITADLGVATTLKLMDSLRQKLKRRELADAAQVKEVLKQEMLDLLAASPLPEISSRPWVVLMVGVNGVGKTTTLAKLAHRDRLRGLSPLLIAGDTFRAAAAEQLEIWGQRVGADVIRQQAGADPAAVVFDGLAAARARGADKVYIDTAGRLHTKVNLMEELKKINRTAAKQVEGAPHEAYLVLDATTGQNAVSQARLFHEAVGLTGIIMTKLDGTAKGGVALAVAHETGLPLRFIGVGESLEDLRPFDPEAFVAAIWGEEEKES